MCLLALGNNVGIVHGLRSPGFGMLLALEGWNIRGAACRMSLGCQLQALQTGSFGSVLACTELFVYSITRSEA